MSTNVDYDILARRMRSAEDSVAELRDAVLDLGSLIAELQDAVTRPARKPRDELNDKIVELLSHTGVLMDPLSIAGNLGVRNEIVSPRCATMANKGTIGRRKEPGKNPLYYALPAGATPLAGSR